MKYKIPFSLFLGAAGGILLALAYVNPYHGAIRLSELVLQLSGSRGEFSLGFSITALVPFMMRLVPGCVFEIYFGTVLYSRFCTAGTFVFSRYPKRVRWYMGEILSLAAMCFLFQLILLISALLMTVFRYQVLLDEAGIYLFMYHLIIHSLWLYSMALCVNLAAIYHGSSASFLSALLLQAACVTLLGMLGTLQKYEKALTFQGVWLNMNPMAHLVLGWHESSLETVDQILNPPYAGFHFIHSFIFMIVLSTIIVLTGAFLIKNYDLIITDPEMEVL